MIPKSHGSSRTKLIEFPMKHPHLLNSDKKASVIILVNEDKKILLQLRDEHAPTAANKWAFFGGGVKPGEDPYECVLRECKQELDSNCRRLSSSSLAAWTTRILTRNTFTSSQFRTTKLTEFIKPRVQTEDGLRTPKRCNSIWSMTRRRFWRQSLNTSTECYRDRRADVDSQNTLVSLPALMRGQKRFAIGLTE